MAEAKAGTDKMDKMAHPSAPVLKPHLKLKRYRPRGPKEKEVEIDDDDGLKGAARKAAVKEGRDWRPSVIHKLTPGASRNHKEFPYDAKADVARHSKAVCHVCRERVESGSVRFCLMLQCHLGYRIACYTHEECFFKHPETAKLDSPSEIRGLSALPEDAQARVHAAMAEPPTAAHSPASSQARSPSKKRAAPSPAPKEGPKQKKKKETKEKNPVQSN